MIFDEAIFVLMGQVKQEADITELQCVQVKELCTAHNKSLWLVYCELIKVAPRSKQLLSQIKSFLLAEKMGKSEIADLLQQMKKLPSRLIDGAKLVALLGQTISREVLVEVLKQQGVDWPEEEGQYYSRYEDLILAIEAREEGFVISGITLNAMTVQCWPTGVTLPFGVQWWDNEGEAGEKMINISSLKKQAKVTRHYHPPWLFHSGQQDFSCDVSFSSSDKNEVVRMAFEEFYDEF